MNEKDKNIQNDFSREEVDLEEIFRVLWDKKYLILFITGIFTFISILYAFIATPIYESRAIVRIGHIEDNFIDSPNAILEKLKIVFDVDHKTSKVDLYKEAIVSKLNFLGREKDLILITTRSYSKDLSAKKINQVVNFLQREYKYKIDNFISQVKNNINDLKQQILHINTVKTNNIIKQIHKIEKEDIPAIKFKINFIKSKVLKNIDEELKYNRDKLEEYQNILSKLSKSKESNSTKENLILLQILNIKDLILDRKSKINDLIEKREKINKVQLKELELKEKELEEELINLRTMLNVYILSQVSEIKKEIELQEAKLKNKVAFNSEVLGKIITYDFPVKPNRKLIISATFVTSLMFSILLAFFIDYLEGIKNKINR